MASSSSSASPIAPAFASQQWKYHVFLSFRGEDTRNTFVGHLYSALERKGIYTYKDDKKLPRGELIGPSLMKAIEESQIAIIVFSENYADSSWCLEELAYIMKCKDTLRQIVIPIFYGVEPSELRKQKQKYGESFVKHELENKTKVESWRKALLDASNISGWDSKSIANRHESEFIEEIVSNISKMLHPLTSRVSESLVGIPVRMQYLKSKSKIGLSGVLMIGIWGVGGGGKTTLASSFYNEIYREFDGHHFLENVREESRKYGLKRLQVDILLRILKERIELGGVEEGKRMIRDRLCRRKVLLVLDDVDQLDQLEALAGYHNWFGEGSRIIITTRDEHVLTAHNVDVIHHISLLSDDEAIQLFCMHAPGDKILMDDYGLLSKEVVRYADGLPLALKVLARFLCDKDVNEWRSALGRLRKIPHHEILEKLKISYDGLTAVEQNLFLDIACFFRWEKKDRAMGMLDACGFHPVIGVKVLMQKTLITISNGMFDMHDMVQEMAHHIVRGEHPENPEKHSRVWKEEDVLNICAMDATTELDVIEAIRIKEDWADRLQHLPQIVANMKNLRWIDWEGDIASPLPTDFSPRKLRYLRLGLNSQRQLWEGSKLLPNLKTIELHGLNNLIMTPDFDGLPNLERFVLHSCFCLEEIHPSVGRLERLVFLSIEYCYGLKVFPPITQLKNLKTLSIEGCYGLWKLSEIQQNMDNSRYLHLDNSGEEVAAYKKNRANFFVNLLTCCSNPTEVNIPGEDMIDVEEGCLEEPCLPLNNLNHHIGLTKLDLSYCKLGDEATGSDVWELPNLQELELKGNKFSRLDFSRLRLPRLKWLNVSSCQGLVGLSDLPSSIAVVIAEGCLSLESFGDISNCKWLWKVALRWGDKLDPLGGYRLLDSMLQGNAIEDHFISVSLAHQIPKGFVGRFFGGYSFTLCLTQDSWHTFTLRLPDDWYNDFCGFLIRFVTIEINPDINIIFTHEVDEKDTRFEVWQESYKAPEPEYDGKLRTYVGYVSFSSLRRTTLLDSSYNIISFSIEKNVYLWKSFGAELVPRERKDDPVQTTEVGTHSSEYWNDELDTRKAFTIQHDLHSFVQILWQP